MLMDHPRRILIVSSHPLFRDGLKSLLHKRDGARVEIVGTARNTDEAIAALKTHYPDLVIVDHDDTSINRDEFLARFIEDQQPMRVVLVSLKETGPVVVYDRRTVAAGQIDDWLNDLEIPKHPITLDESRRGGMKHFIVVAILIAIVTVLVSAGLEALGLMPLQASAQAVPIDNLFGMHVKVISFLFALIVVFMLYSLVVFRRKPGDTGDGAHFEGHTGLEIAWTILPLATVLYFSYLGAGALAETMRADPQAMQVKVIGSQWNWRFEYPDGNVSSSTLYLPKDKQVLLKLSSTDVIHSFWVPEFRVKQDALPGDTMVKELRVTATKTGEYKVRCAELCGQLHATMESPVVVMEANEFAAWLDKEAKSIPTDPVERGRRWSTQFGCIACHSLDGKAGIGPSWKGVYGREEELTTGQKVKVDDTYIRESIRNPSAKLVKGFTTPMPVLTLSDAQIADLIEYLKTLK